MIEKDLVHFVLRFPPSVNRYYVKTRNGVFISRQGRSFREYSTELIHQQLGAFTSIEHKIKVGVVLYPPDRRIRDLDNYMKGLLDAITHANIWDDDSLIDQLYIHRGSIIKGGRTEIYIVEAEPIIPIGYGPVIMNQILGDED